MSAQTNSEMLLRAKADQEIKKSRRGQNEEIFSQNRAKALLTPEKPKSKGKASTPFSYMVEKFGSSVCLKTPPSSSKKMSKQTPPRLPSSSKKRSNQAQTHEPNILSQNGNDQKQYKNQPSPEDNPTNYPQKEFENNEDFDVDIDDLLKNFDNLPKNQNISQIKDSLKSENKGCIKKVIRYFLLKGISILNFDIKGAP